MTPANDGGREAIVDKINSHDHGDEAEGSEVELKSGEHQLGLGATPRGWADDGIRRRQFTKGGNHGIHRKRILNANLNRSEATAQIQQLLRPADIHRGNAGIRRHCGVVCFQIKAMAQDHGTPCSKNAEFIWQITPRRQGDDLGFAQPHFQIKGLTSRVL